MTRFPRQRRRQWVSARWSIAVSSALLAAACALHRPSPPASWVADELPNYRRINGGLATANVATLAAIPKLAPAGFKTIVDLRAPTENGVAEEAAAAERAGLRYVNIPVTAATLNGERVRQVAAELDQPASRPVLLHCASGNRVGAVMDLYWEEIHGVDPETARKEAQAIGLQAPAMLEAVQRVRSEMQSGR